VSEYRRALEHAGRHFPPPYDALSRLRRRRERKGLRRRIVAGATALVIAAGGTGVALVALGRFEPRSGRPDASNVASLRLAWTAKAEGTARVAAVGNRVYVGAEDGNLYAFVATCGTDGVQCRPLWVGHTGLSIGSSPVVSDGIVFVAAATPRRQGNVFAFPASCGAGGGTCRPLWRGLLDVMVDASPTVTVAADTVYVASDPGSVSAFPANCRTDGGICLPNSRVQAVLQESFPAPPVVLDGRLYVVDSDRRLRAYAAGCERGECHPPLWSASLGPLVPSGLAAADGLLFVTSSDPERSSGQVRAFRASCGLEGATCEPAWTATTRGPVDAAPVAAEGRLFVADATTIYAFPTSCGHRGPTCDPMWTAALPTVTGLSAAPGGLLFAASADGSLSAFDATCRRDPRCRPLWTWEAGTSALTPPSVTQQAVSVGSAQGRVFVFRLPG